MTTTLAMVAESSTGKLHRATHYGAGIRGYYTANCASGYRYGTRTVYLRSARELSTVDMATADLCERCFTVEAV